MFDVTVATAIADIDKEVWETLASQSHFMSYGWLKTLEETAVDDVVPLYYLLERNGDAVAATVCYVSDKFNPHDRINRFILDRLEKPATMLGITFNPSVRFGPLHGYGDHILLKDGLSSSSRLACVEQIVTAVESEARRRKVSLFCVNVSEMERDLCDTLLRRGYHVTMAHPKNRLDVTWGSFDEYLGDKRLITAKHRREFMFQIKKNAQAGVTIRELEKVEQEERLYQLLSGHYYRLNRVSYPYSSKLFSAMKRNLGDDVTILVAEKAGQIVAVGVTFQRGKTGWASFVGLDYESTRDDFSYFNIAYYEVIKRAIARGAATVYYGDTMYWVKKRRGCRLEQNYIFHKGYNRLMHGLWRPWFVLHRAWYEKRKIPRALSCR